MSYTPPRNRFFTPPLSHYDVIRKGITTRVMAQKQILQLQKDNEEKNTQRVSLSERRTSKFLSGTSIPNSTIRANLDSSYLLDLTLPNSSNSKRIEGNSRQGTFSFAEKSDSKLRCSSRKDLEEIKKASKSVIQKQDLQTQTSFILENLFIPTQSN